MNNILRTREKGNLIVISGPSGAGKGTIISKILESNDNVWLSVSMTSREIRSNDVPDIGADGMFTRMYVKNISKDFANIKKGAIVHMSGHVGVYIGDGMVVECSPKWENKVQLTVLGNLNSIYRKTGNIRMWDEYGYLPCIDYSEESSVKNDVIEVETIVRKNGVEIERRVINVP